MCVKICMTLVFGMKKAQQMGYVLCCASCCFLEHLCAAKQMCFHTSYIRARDIPAVVWHIQCKLVKT